MNVMDTSGILQNIQKTFIILITVWNRLFITAVNVSWMEICQPKNKTVAGQLHIKSPGFPEAWTGHIKCQCDIEGHSITIATRTLVLSGESVLEVSHNDQENKSSWPKDNKMTMWDKINRKLVIARNATKIKVSIDKTTTKGPANTITLFMFDFQAGEEMSVRCQNFTSINRTEDQDTPTTTTEDQETPTNTKKDQGTPNNTTKKDDTPNNLLEQIGSVCSPHLVIILGSLCCALLLIILIVSIILCCIVPRKRKKYTIDYRNQQVTEEKNLRKAAKNDRDSVIYDQAKVNMRASAAFNNTTYADDRQHGYSNTGSQLLQRSNTVPAQCVTRQSAQYVNSVVT